MYVPKICLWFSSVPLAGICKLSQGQNKHIYLIGWLIFWFFSWMDFYPILCRKRVFKSVHVEVHEKGNYLENFFFYACIGISRCVNVRYRDWIEPSNLRGGVGAGTAPCKYWMILCSNCPYLSRCTSHLASVQRWFMYKHYITCTFLYKFWQFCAPTPCANTEIYIVNVLLFREGSFPCVGHPWCKN